MNNSYQALTDLAAPLGLTLRGGFAVEPGDLVPDLPNGRRAKTLILLGATGGSLWPAFSASPEAGDGAKDPLDRWSKRVIEGLAKATGALALFPFGGPPYLPFQRWAQRAEPVNPSPLGLFIHPVYGLWHSYRGALALAEEIATPAKASAAHPCDSCQDKPCLSTCPVNAFQPPQEGRPRYDIAACARHLRAPEGAPCMAKGCLARLACPIGRNFAYSAPQAHFHMRAFLAARQET